MKNKLKLQIALSSILNLWYGALCWMFLGFIGILIGSIFLTSAVLVGVLFKKLDDQTMIVLLLLFFSLRNWLIPLYYFQESKLDILNK